MTEARLRNYESTDAEDLNRVARAAYGQYRDKFDNWPAMLDWLSKASSLSATGEMIVAEIDNSVAGSVAYFGPGKARCRIRHRAPHQPDHDRRIADVSQDGIRESL